MRETGGAQGREQAWTWEPACLCMCVSVDRGGPQGVQSVATSGCGQVPSQQKGHGRPSEGRQGGVRSSVICETLKLETTSALVHTRTDEEWVEYHTAITKNRPHS